MLDYLAAMARRKRKGQVIIPGSNRRFRELFDKYEKKHKLDHVAIGEMLGMKRKTVGRRLNSFKPIDYDFVLRTAVIFDLDEEAGCNYFAAAGYSMSNYDVRDTKVVWKILKMHGRSLEEKNAVLNEYGYDEVKRAGE